MSFYSVFSKIVNNIKDQATGDLLTKLTVTDQDTVLLKHSMLTVHFPKLFCWLEMVDGAYDLNQFTNLRIKITLKANP